MSDVCEVKRIQQNSAQSIVDQATAAFAQSKADYVACLGPQEQGKAALENARPTMEKLAKEVETIAYMEKVILGQLRREKNAGQTLATLAESAQEEEARVQEEIERLRSEIRTEKRRFLDSSPSSSTAVAGLYFTQEPDNQVLIAFLSCFGAFLLFVSLLVIMNQIPIFYFQGLTSDQRIKLVATGWILAAVTTYLAFFIFT